MSELPARPWYHAAFGDHYPHLYAHRDLGEARRCLDLLARLAPFPAGPILDLGCGQGRHLQVLAERGLPAFGLDLSASLLAAARTAAPAARLVRGDMRRLPLRDHAFATVLSLFTAFGYFGDLEAHRPVVGEIARVLVPGGSWCLDFLDSERVAADLAQGVVATERVLAAGAVHVHEERRLLDGPRRVAKTVALQPAVGRQADAARVGVPPAGLHYMEEVTLLNLEELDDLATGAGLRRIAAAGSYDGAPLVPGHSERWLLVFAQRSARDRTR